MEKTLLTYMIVFVLLFFLGYQMHECILKESHWELSFSLKEVYIFHAVFSLIICIALFLISKSNALKDQIGFLYLGAFIFKLVAFATTFTELFFNDMLLTYIDKISLLFPVFIFLVPEVYFVVKILGNLNIDKK